jgi:energy-coupling factor transporter ATP-binding protein EcfA2
VKLLSIKAKNFRTLQSIELSFSQGYCTISGKNNAGKSSVIRLLSTLFRQKGALPWVYDNVRFDFKEDHTQWIKQNTPIEVSYGLELARADDPALISFIERIASIDIPATVTVPLEMTYQVNENDDIKVAISVNSVRIEDKAAKEIDKKIKDSNLLFLYNSTSRHEEVLWGPGRRRMFFEFVMSGRERKELDEASKSIERRFRRLAKQHTEGLNSILGRLSERYDVELSPPESSSAHHMPIGINLRDKHVEVPLDDWGSGTQNRTQILLMVLQAQRIKTKGSEDDKITPIVVIEEPESFLHPSAQSEFGQILQRLSEEFGIQIISTTHSPYMLNRENPGANILFSRERKRGKAYQTNVVDTSENGWMAPFAEHLGIEPSEFNTWRPVFSAFKSKVLLVEGDIDREYFQYFQSHDCPVEGLSQDVEVVPYGGKDTLKNTLLVQFVLSKFDRVFITYDLDARKDVEKALGRLSLKSGSDFLPLGLDQPGKDCIEGLIPSRVLDAVNGRETDLVMALGSPDKHNAKQKLKRMYLHEFKSQTDYKKDELKEMTKVLKTINARFSRPL